MRFKNVRIHLRHRGRPEFVKPRYNNVTRKWSETSTFWGHNFEFGRWLIVLRRPDTLFDKGKKKGFFDLEMGRAQLKESRR